MAQRAEDEYKKERTRDECIHQKLQASHSITQHQRNLLNLFKMFKTLAASLVLLAGSAMAMTPNPQTQSLKPRSDYCGTDRKYSLKNHVKKILTRPAEYNIDWYCVNSDTSCCVGSVQGVCMPTGYSCCDTGFYCEPDEQCYLVGNVQYCIKDGNKAEATRTAESHSVGETEGSKSKDDDDDDEDNSAVASTSNRVLLLLPLLGAVAAWL